MDWIDHPTLHTPDPVRWHPTASTANRAAVINVVDDRTSSIEFQLPPRLSEITVSGRTVSPDGAPIQGVSLFLHDVDTIVGLSDIWIATSDQTAGSPSLDCAVGASASGERWVRGSPIRSR